MFAAVLDACVLYPLTFRDILLYSNLVVGQLYAPIWSDEILDEMARNLIERGRLQPERAPTLIDGMNRAFPDALRNPPRELIDAMTNDPKDRHVLATAVHAGAQVIVTENLQDFPAEALEPYAIEAQRLDEFLSNLFSLNPTVVEQSVRYVLGRYKRPPFTTGEYLEAIAKQAPTFADQLAQVL